MRFLMLNWRDPLSPLAGGAERVSQAYLAELVRRGHEVSWYAFEFPGAKPGDEVKGVKIIRGGGKGTAIVKARRWYRQQAPFDLVIDQHHGIAWFAPWWCKTNCVAYIHEVLGPIWNTFYRWPWNTIGRWQESWTHRLYSRTPFWVPSDSTKKNLQQHGVRDITVRPNGCDTVPLQELAPKPLAAPLRLITVSRLAPNKRIDHVIRAVQLLKERGVASQLTVIGSGEAQAQLEALAHDLGLSAQITFTGSLSESAKNEQLQTVHLLLHTSVREGWGLNVIEANAMGTPAVVYPVAGLVDSTIHGETGEVVRDQTPEALVEALQALLANPARYDAYRRSAWERSKRFQWNRVIADTCDWLEQKARGGGPPATTAG